MKRQVVFALLLALTLLGWNVVPAAAAPAAAGSAAPLAATYTTATSFAPRAPRNGVTATVTGTLRKSGAAVRSATMTATWHLGDTTATCQGTTNRSGAASCSRPISNAPVGGWITVDLRFTSSAGAVLATTSLRMHESTGDRDGDGVADATDKCPDTPETYNGIFDSDGCADTIQDLVDFAQDDINGFWRTIFQENSIPYSGPRTFKGYSSRIRTACGRAPLYNAFYCGADHSIYYDLRLFNQVLKDDGDFAPVIILAHEWGHLVQRNLGLDADAYYTVQIELQADCYAGVYARYAQQAGTLEEGDMEEAITAFFSSGDDLDFNDPRHHGTPDERVSAFTDGFDQGIDACEIR
jgi:predicted metalloprotease